MLLRGLEGHETVAGEGGVGEARTELVREHLWRRRDWKKRLASAWKRE